MCIKVENFLGCATLENFGLVYGCLHFVTLLIVAGLLCVLNPYLFFNGAFAWTIICSVFLAVVLFTMYVCIEFIHGVVQRNHERMTTYRNAFAVGLVFSPLHLLALIATYDQAYQHDSIFGNHHRLNLFVAIPIIIVNFIVNFYVICCINTLYGMFKGGEESKQVKSKLNQFRPEVEVDPSYFQVKVIKPPRNIKIGQALP